MVFGTHGLPDGSVIYWQTQKNKKKKDELINKSQETCSKIMDEIKKNECYNPTWSY